MTTNPLTLHTTALVHQNLIGFSARTCNERKDVDPIPMSTEVGHSHSNARTRAKHCSLTQRYTTASAIVGSSAPQLWRDRHVTRPKHRHCRKHNWDVFSLFLTSVTSRGHCRYAYTKFRKPIFTDPSLMYGPIKANVHGIDCHLSRSKRQMKYLPSILLTHIRG